MGCTAFTDSYTTFLEVFTVELYPKPNLNTV